MGAYLDRTVTLTAGQAYSVGNGTAYADLAAAVAAKASLEVEGVFAILVSNVAGNIDVLRLYEKVAGGSQIVKELVPPPSGEWEQYVFYLREGWDVIVNDSGAGGAVRVSVRRVDADTVADL